MLGFAFPLFGQQMFDALGLGGGNSVRTLAVILCNTLTISSLTALGRPCNCTRHPLPYLDLL